MARHYTLDCPSGHGTYEADTYDAECPVCDNLAPYEDENEARINRLVAGIDPKKEFIGLSVGDNRTLMYVHGNAHEILHDADSVVNEQRVTGIAEWMQDVDDIGQDWAVWSPADGSLDYLVVRVG
jgi:hypothetical protein